MATRCIRVPGFRLTWPMVERGEIQITMPLTPLEMSAMIALLCHRVISMNDLIECIWPDADTSPEWAESAACAVLRRLRCKGVPITCAPGIGYRLADPYTPPDPDGGCHAC